MAGLVMPGVSGTAMASNKALLRELRRAEKHGQIDANRLKIQLLGDSGAGKTSLRKHLMGESVKEGEEPRTVGIERYDLEYHQVTDDWSSYNGGSEYDRCTASWLMQRNKAEIGASLTNHIASNMSPDDVPPFIFIMFPVISILLAIYGLPLGFGAHYAFYLALSWVSFRSWSSVYTLAAGAFFVVFLRQVCLQAEGLDSMDKQYMHALVIISHFLLGVWLLYIGVRGLITGLCLLNPPVMAIWRGIKDHQEWTLYPEVSSEHFKDLVIAEFINGALIALLVFIIVSHSSSSQKALKLLLLGLLLFTAHYMNLSTSLHQSLWIAFLFIGFYVGRKLVLRYRLPYFSKIFIGIVTGVSIGIFLGWEFKPSFLNTGALVYFAMDVGDWWFPKISIPVTELVTAMKDIEKGHTDLPIVYTVMDFAGNPEYTNMHYTFISEQALYVIVFDLCQLQLHSPNVQLKRIRYWLNNIRMKISVGTRPVVFLVGSHRDTMPYGDHAQEDIECFAKLVTKTFQNIRQFEDWFVVNKSSNTVLHTIENTNKLKDDANSTQFRSRLLKKGRQYLEKFEPNALRWFHIIDLCNREREKGSKFMIVEDLYKQCITSKEHDLSDLTDQELRRCLCFANTKDFIIYMDDVSLRDWIILDPRYLVDVMARFQEPNRNWGYLLDRHIKYLDEKGIASEKIVRRILKDVLHPRCDQLSRRWPLLYETCELVRSWCHSLLTALNVPVRIPAGCNSPEAEIMFEFLQRMKFFIRVEADPKDKNEDIRFLLPCRLPHGEDDDLAVMAGNTQWTSHLYIDCGEFSVESCFPAFIAQYLHQYSASQVRHQLDKCKFYRDRARIYNPDFGTMVLQCEHGDEEQHLLHICIAADNELKQKAIQWILTAFHHIAKHDHIEYESGVLCPNPACEYTHHQVHILPVLEIHDDDQMVVKREVWCNDVKIVFDMETGVPKVQDRNELTQRPFGLKLQLIQNWERLVAEMLTSELCDHLIAKNVITPDDQQSINGEKNDRAKARALLLILERKQEPQIQIFIEKLKDTQQTFLAELFTQ